MTFNLHHGVGTDGRLDLERSAALVEAGAADVVALQEVDRHLGPRSGPADQPALLAARLGEDGAYGVNVTWPPRTPGAPPREYGTALLSRTPIVWWRNVALPMPLGGEARGLLEALVDLDGTVVRVLGTHLQHDSDAGRAAQVDVVAAVASASREPVVLLGDLNAEPGAPELAALDGVLVDAWAVAGDGPGLTFPSTRPRMRIDHVLASSGLVPTAAAVVATDASDHRPVVVDLTLTSAARGG